MVQIKSGNPRFRSKEDIAEDIAFILRAPVKYGTKFAVLAEAMWVWTESTGKYEGCPYWTPLAMAVYAVNRMRKRGKYHGLRHEHVVPKRVVMDMLESLETPTPEAVHAICEKFLHAVVVTVEEDSFLNLDYQSTMPAEFEDLTSEHYHDPWLRYRRCSIQWMTESEARERLVRAAPHLAL